MSKVKLLFVLILGWTQSLNAQTNPASGCSYLESDKPSVYISYVRQGSTTNKKGKTEPKAFLRLHNNSNCEISVRTPDNSLDPLLFKHGTKTLSDGRTITGYLQHPSAKDFDLEIHYDIKESKTKDWKPANYWGGGDLVFKYTIPPGYSAAFPIDERYFLKKLPILILFEYDWEDSDELRTFGTISHRVTYEYDMPKGYFKEEDPASYPKVWFAAINDPNKPEWEILPQEAKAGEVILSKRNELGILSNFATTPFQLHGKRYASVEGFWQMMLYPEMGPDDFRARQSAVQYKHTREQVAQMTAFEAKSAGTIAEENMKTLGIDWVTFNGKRFPYRSATPDKHYKLIVAAMRAKANQNPEVKRILLATGDLILKPDHHGELEPPPEWKYNEIWMQIRKEFCSETRP